MNTLKLSLLDNGIDFVVVGVEQFFSLEQRTPRDHKYALLHLFSGTLLLLKERLQREHQSFIWVKVVQTGEDAAKTVDFAEAIERIQKICKIDLDKHMPLLVWCQKQRNKLEHYECDLNLNESQNRIGQLVEFIDWFTTEHLKISVQAHVSSLVWQELVELRAISARIRKEEHDEWRKRAKNYFKLTKKRLTQLAETEPYDPKDNPDIVELMECPACGENSIATPDVFEDRDVGICTNLECKDVIRLTKCERCRTLTTEGSFCINCLSYMDHVMSKDD